MGGELRNLAFDRPVAFFDIESTGKDIQRDRVVEIAVAKFFPDGGREIKSRRVNPGIPIPPEATAIHGISDADVKDAPPFKAVAASLAQFLDGCDLGGFNIIKFDLPMLRAEFGRASVPFRVEGRRILDAQVIYHKMEPRNLSAAVRFFCGRSHDGAHGAEADVLATVEVLDAQLARYPGLPRDAAALHDFCSASSMGPIDIAGRFRWNAEGVPVLAFGPHFGAPLRDVAKDNPGFLAWIASRDFPEDTKRIAKDALAGRFPTRSAP